MSMYPDNFRERKPQFECSLCDEGDIDPRCMEERHGEIYCARCAEKIDEDDADYAEVLASYASSDDFEDTLAETFE